MNTFVKTGAALRPRNSAEPVPYDASRDAEAAKPRADTLRENLYRFPSIGIPPTKPRLQVEPPRPESAAAPAEPAIDEAPLARLEDLAAELEAALMSDLNEAMLAGGPDRRVLAPKPAALSLAQAEIEHGLAGLPAHGEDLPQHDRLAVELLLARGQRRSPFPAPRPREIVEDRLAGELAQRLSEAVDGLKLAHGEILPDDRDLVARRPRRSVVFNRPLVAVAVALAVVGGGALLTVRSLTVNPDVPASITLAETSTGEIAASSEDEPATAVKQSYDRAAADSSLPDAPQLPGTDGMLPAALSVVAGSAGGTSVVEPSVRAAYSMDATPATGAVAAAADLATAPEARPATPEPVAAAAIAGPGASKAHITSGVRLRGNPDNSAPTVGYLKAGTPVDVVSCKGWCEVVADGKRGFVFKRFLAGL